jgi:hypothetical protein
MEYTINQKTLNILLDNSFALCLNASDYFDYSESDSVMLYPEDFHWALPIIEKYEHDGVNAVMSYIRSRMPVIEWRTERFSDAFREIELLNPKVESKELFEYGIQ